MYFLQFVIFNNFYGGSMNIIFFIFTFFLGFVVPKWSSAMRPTFTLEHLINIDQDLTLLSCDGEEVKVSDENKGMVWHSLTIRAVIEDEGIENSIPVANVRGKTLKHILEVLKKIKERGDGLLQQNQAPKKGQVKALVEHCQDFSLEELKELFLAANYLDIQGLLYATGALLGKKIIKNELSSDDPFLKNLPGQLGFFIFDRLFEYAHDGMVPEDVMRCFQLGEVIEDVRQKKDFSKRSNYFLECLKKFEDCKLSFTEDINEKLKKASIEPFFVIPDFFRRNPKLFLISAVTPILFLAGIHKYILLVAENYVGNGIMTRLIVSLPFIYIGSYCAFRSREVAKVLRSSQFDRLKAKFKYEFSLKIIRAIHDNNLGWALFLMNEAVKNNLISSLYKPQKLSTINYAKTAFFKNIGNIFGFKNKHQLSMSNPLLEAIKSNNLAILKQLLKKLKNIDDFFAAFGDPKACCENPLEYALIENKHDVLRYIIKFMNKYQHTALDNYLQLKYPINQAFDFGDEETLKIIIEAFQNLGILNGHRDVFKNHSFKFLVKIITKKNVSIDFLKFFSNILDTLEISSEVLAQKDKDAKTIADYALATKNEEVIKIFNK